MTGLAADLTEGLPQGETAHGSFAADAGNVTIDAIGVELPIFIDQGLVGPGVSGSLPDREYFGMAGAAYLPATVFLGDFFIDPGPGPAMALIFFFRASTSSLIL